MQRHRQYDPHRVSHRVCDAARRACCVSLRVTSLSLVLLSDSLSRSLALSLSRSRFLPVPLYLCLSRSDA
eukprot:282576-Rhodomonas_salina.2